jgi:purine-binding chemotaxis protein CheW
MTSTSDISGKNPAAPGATRQLLTFCLGDETYGMDILRVQELRGWTPVTRVPKAPDHMLGVLNLRGSIVPIIDMRRRFNLAKADFTPLTVIVVVSVQLESGRREFGMVVDSVSEVIDLAADQVQETPEIGARSSEEFILGLATAHERMVILLDIDRLVKADLERIAPEAEAA